ncbi:MAG: DNA polymerase III subunit epsilon [Proteobacteria bacterium]|nr:DNA polymerase III subunit epsilon [Pseudomonadota bacterium]
MSREIVLDIETTDLWVKDGHRIIDVTAVELVDGKSTGALFHSYINPERDVPQQLLTSSGKWIKHPAGLSNEFLADKPVFASIAKELHDFIGNSPIIITCRTENDGYTVDVAFLNMEMEKAGLPSFKDEQWLNVRKWAEAMFGNKDASLDKMLDRYKIDRSERIANGHGATLDAILLSDVYPKLLKDYTDFVKYQPELKQVSKKIPPII